VWLRGSTTYQNLVDDLVKLICGEIADGAANTVPLADRWRRSFAGVNHIRPPATQDVTLDAGFRAGYFSLMSTLAGAPNFCTASQAVCRCTNIYTSNPTAGQIPSGKWVVSIVVNTANTVPGNYSTLRVSWDARDIEGLFATPWISGNNVSPNAAGQLTIGNGMTVQFSDPSGIVPAGISWFRGFTTTYVGGIDCWGQAFAAFGSGNASFSSSPSGTSGTDWDANVKLGGNMQSNTNYSNGQAAGAGINYQKCFSNGTHFGLGIKTNTGLSGNTYAITFPAAPGFFWKINPVTGGQVIVDRFCGVAADSTATYRRVCGWSWTDASWLIPFTAAGSVTPGAQVQYWMSVKDDHICVVLNGNPAFSGQSTCNWISKFNPYLTQDKFPWFMGTHYLPSQNWAGCTWRSVVSLGKFQDGSENRDWQTHWGRQDHADGPGLTTVSSSFSSATSEPVMELGSDHYATSGGGGQSGGRLGKTLWHIGFGISSAIQSSFARAVGESFNPTFSQKPHGVDGKWWLLGSQVTDLPGNAAYLPTSYQWPRGVFTNKAAFYIPESGWASGDEITDGVTGDVYFLIGANDHRIYVKTTNQSSVVIGGAAIREA
jgi:hypothetical protein